MSITLIPTAYAADGVFQNLSNQSGIPTYARPGGNVTIMNLLTGKGVNLITFAFGIIGLIFMANIIIAGWQYMTSSGDPKTIAQATTRFINGFIGLGIAFFAFLIVNLITNVIGIGSLI